MIGIGVIVIFGLIVFFATVKTIPQGYVGIVYDKASGGVTSHELHPGWNIIVPFVQTITAYPTAFRTYTMSQAYGEGARQGDDSIKITTADNQTLHQDLSVTYQIRPNWAHKIFSNFKGASIEFIEDTYIRRSIITAASTKAGSQFAILDAYGTKKPQFEDLIFRELDKLLQPQGFQVIAVNLGEGHIDDAVKQSIEAPLRAQALTKEAEAQLNMKRAQAEQKIIEAEADAKSRLIRAEAEAKANQMLAQSLSPLLVEKIKIEKLNPNVQVIYVPSNGNMFFGLPNNTK